MNNNKITNSFFF